MARSTARPVLPSVRRPFRAIGRVVLPRPDALDEGGWERAEAIIERALADRPRAMREQLRLFLRIANLLPLPSTGRTLAGLPQNRRTAFLRRLERSRMVLLRRGLWGVRTLVFMGYYNQEDVRRGIGYKAHPGGWDARSAEDQTAGPTRSVKHEAREPTPPRNDEVADPTRPSEDEGAE